MTNRHEQYEHSYAVRSLEMVQRPYTRAKDDLLAKELVTYVPSGGLIVDVGGNLNATLEGRLKDRAQKYALRSH